MDKNKKRLVRPTKERVFFWALFTLTLVHIVLIISVSFGYGEVSRHWTKIYLVALGTYAGVKKWSQFGKENNNKRKGEYFVILFWFLAAGLYVWKGFSSDSKLIISQELSPTVIGVTLIYCSADIIKRFSGLGGLIKKVLERYLEGMEGNGEKSES